MRESVPCPDDPAAAARGSSEQARGAFTMIEDLTAEAEAFACRGIESDGGDHPAGWYVGRVALATLERWRERWWDRLARQPDVHEAATCQKRIDALGEAIGLAGWAGARCLAETNQSDLKRQIAASKAARTLARWEPSARETFSEAAR